MVLNSQPKLTERIFIMSNFTYFDRLGNQIVSGSTISEALEQSSLNYTVVKKPLFLEDGTLVKYTVVKKPLFLEDGTLVKDSFCTLKDDDNTQLENSIPSFRTPKLSISSTTFLSNRTVRLSEQELSRISKNLLWL